MTESFIAYKSGSGWFFDDFRKGRKIKKEALVQGIPEIIETLGGSGIKKVRLTFGDEPFEGALQANLVDDNVDGGVLYDFNIMGNTMRGWLCSVFWVYFSKPAPKTLYAKLESVNLFGLKV